MHTHVERGPLGARIEYCLCTWHKQNLSGVLAGVVKTCVAKRIILIKNFGVQLYVHTVRVSMHARECE